uniref:Fungal STAND N-terminal Goodbye domain-containing protein n=1 Tax=Bionectria ochroleuca TaxID=29856 RepID=A0A0B7KQ66_BIOOC
MMTDADGEDYLASRMEHPSTHTAAFIENQVRVAGEPAPIFISRLNRVDSLEVAKTQQKISDELWKEANEEKTALLALMDQVRAKLDKSNPVTAHISRLDARTCSWDQVLQEAEILASRWSSSPKRASKMLHLDRLGRNSEAFQAWIGLLPVGDFGSSICGVFTIALNAAGQYVKVEDAIIDALAQIPEAVSDTRRYIKLYAETKGHRLEERTFDLYLSILKALNHIMRFFAERSVNKFAGSLFKQHSYQKELFSSIDNIKAQVSRVKEESEHCMQRRVADMQKSIVNTDQNATKSLQLLQALYNQLILQEPRSSFDQGDNMISLGRKLSGVTASYNKKQLDSLLTALQYDDAAVSRDMQTCLRNGYASDEAFQAKAAMLIGSPELKNFIVSNANLGTLLINGNEDMSTTEGASPVSLVSARIAIASESTPQTLCLSFFCTEHRPYGGPPGPPAPAAMMASLTAQLLTKMVERSFRIDLSFCDDLEAEDISGFNLKTLCVIFSELAKQIPEGTILICLIDGIDMYETGDFREDVDTVMRRMARQVSKRTNMIFKLIVTCTGRARAIQTHFASVINMEESVEPDDSSRWRIDNSDILGDLRDAES